MPIALMAACWRPIADSSELTFSVPQAGNEVHGQFRKFRGLICLDASGSGNDRAEIEVETASIETGLPELDEILRGELFFAAGQWPLAQFTSREVRRTGPESYEAAGSFTIRDITREITVPFTIPDAQEPERRVTGELLIDRRDFNVGLGEWRETEMVGDSVTIRFSLLLAAPVVNN